MTTLTEFLMARIAEDEAKAQAAVTCNGAAWTASDLHHSGWRISGTTNIGNPHSYGDEMDSLWDDEGAMGMWPETAAHVVAHDPARVLAECEAKRRIVEWHANWPVLAETQPEIETVGSDPASMTFRMTKQVAWLTEQEYRTRFGAEPPSGPILRMLALPYADHPEFREEWRP